MFFEEDGKALLDLNRLDETADAPLPVEIALSGD
jgi:hypothetical protein